MPQVDMTLHPCKWCGTTERTFVCDDCNRYTCRECKVASREDGCMHVAAKPVTSQSWCEASGVRLDPAIKNIKRNAQGLVTDFTVDHYSLSPEEYYKSRIGTWPK